MSPRRAESACSSGGPPPWRRSGVALALGAALLLAACHTPAATSPGLVRPWDPRLTVPPDEGAAAALEGAAPAVRTAYLVELFDAARLIGDDASRRLLGQSLGLDPQTRALRGEAATTQVLTTLGDAAERSGLAGLAELLDDDREELVGADPIPIAARRKRLAVADPAAAPHALWSLYAACARALTDAARAPAWRRATIANHCLHSLADADPSPYFRRDPSTRPPDPPWRFHLAGLRHLLDRRGAIPPRTELVLERLRRQLRELDEAIAADGLAPPSPDLLAPRLPLGDERLPAYDRETWAIVDGGMVVVGRARFHPRDHELLRRLEQPLTAARLTGLPARLALFVPADAGADVVDSLIEAATRGGAESLALVLAAPIRLQVPAGDPWAAAPPSHRFGLVPLQLKPASARDLPRQLDSRATALTLIASPEGLSVFAADGAVDLGPLPTVEARLLALRRAFPDESQVALAVDPAASYRQLLEVALLARRHFRRLALQPMPHRPRGDGLVRRLARRESARFVVDSDDPAWARHGDLLRGCYLEALETRPELWGELIARPGSPLLLDGGDEDAALRDCLRPRLEGIGVKAPVRLRFAPR